MQSGGEGVTRKEGLPLYFHIRNARRNTHQKASAYHRLLCIKTTRSDGQQKKCLTAWAVGALVAGFLAVNLSHHMYAIHFYAYSFILIAS
ncbi:hypothetical protein [Yersinia entomophaga]|uniref:hypothetical protein n=1 Tax=Yersinia entomophaga TaxID=935293 RepID=UPI000B74BCB2|nr:hypothetical protein [Yersinia entomophaga]OWF87107.1 hypothetical protein B4914_12865 [Yersinia entomophaga]